MVFLIAETGALPFEDHAVDIVFHMRNLFPDGMIVRERAAALTLGPTKSLIEIKQ